MRLNTSAPRDSRFRKHAVRFSVTLSIWLIVGLLVSGQTYFAARVNDAPQQWSAALATTLPWYGAWALLTPLVVWAAHLLPFKPGKALNFILAHIPIAIAISTAHALLYVGALTYLYRDSPHFPSSGSLLAIKLSGGLHINLMTYTIIMGLLVAARAYGALRDREVSAARMEAQLLSAEAAALRAQLQPHFIFNTLNAISGLVPNDQVRAMRLIAGLGDLLRLSIADDRRSTSTVADELAFVDAYLLIEQERLGDRLRVERDIDPDTLAMKIPALLLQPLVENAIRHGLAPLVRGGTLRLSAKLTASRILLTVSDDGGGADMICDGVGLGNTRRRLLSLYGQNHGILITSKPGKGFTVLIEIPR